MIGSVLTVTIIEARDLRPTRITGGINPYVVVEIEGQQQQTDQVNGVNDPVWNEVIPFDVVHG